MKKIIVILVAMAMVWSCTDMLEQSDPTGPTGEDFFKTATDLEQAVVAAYAGLSLNSSYAAIRCVGFEQFTDNVFHGSGNTDGGHATWNTFNYDPTSSAIRDIYETYYQGINLANQVITRGSEADVSGEVLTQALAEVTFLRAYNHFMLTLIWGDVPIVTELPADPAGFTPATSPASDVYDQVIADLQFAEANLSPVAAQGGRITSWTAKAMLAKVYLFGADELGNNAWYGLAEQKAAEVINGGPFDLFDDLPTPAENLESIFMTYNENGVEHVFTINHFNSGGNWSNPNVGSQFPMAMNPRQQRNNSNMWGFGWAYVYEAIDGLWDDADARKDYNIWFQGEPIIVNGVDRGAYDQNNQNRCCARPGGMGFQKFWYQEKTKNVNGWSTLGFPEMRFADLLLMYAEADLLADGNISQAGVDAINRVRNRAGLADLSIGDVDINVIMDERRWELFGEFKRWFDFVRKRDRIPNMINDAFAAIVAGDTNNDDNDFAGFTPERHWKLPYPQAAIDRNPNIVQKSAWSGSE